MSRTIDERVVEMRFDNKQFESATKETLGTLAKLKEALKLPSLSKSVDDINKAGNKSALSGLISSVEALEKRFSTLGIVGMRVIENITDGLMNKLTKAVHFATDAMISGGVRRAMNIENAHFQLQNLLKDEAKVQEVMDDAMTSVDGTAYAFDEAAKAAAMFSASGIQAGDDMLGALKGITGVAAMTNSQFQDIAMIFTTVAGNGRLMGDQLLQLSSRGLNVASTLANYFQEVGGIAEMTEADIREMVTAGELDFKTFAEAMNWAFGESAERANEIFTGSLANMKSALARIGAGFISPLIEQNSELVKLFNALRIQINNVKSALVFDEQKSAISGLAKTTGMAKEELTDMFKAVKETGHVTTEQLDMLNKKGVRSEMAIVKYMNGITDGSIHASYAVTSLVNELSEGMEVTTEDVRKFVEEGKIDLNTFQGAMETSYGDLRTLSKQFTDFVLENVQNAVKLIHSIDLTKPLEVFYYFVESVKNIAKGLFSLLKPIGKAFDEVFLSFSMDSIVTLASKVEALTSKLKLSEKQTKNVQKTFKGLFDVVKLLIDIFFKLIRIIVPVNEPIVELGDGLLGVTASLGETLSAFTEWVRNSPAIAKAYDKVSGAVQKAMSFLADMVRSADEFLEKVRELPAVKKIIDKVTEAFNALGDAFAPLFDDVGAEFIKFFEDIEASIPTDAGEWLDGFLGSINDFAEKIDQKGIIDFFTNFIDKIREFIDLIRSNEGFDIFLDNMIEFFNGLKDAFTIDTLLDKLDYVKERLGSFIDWIKETFAPVFENFSVGGVLAAGGGGGILYVMMQAIKVLDKWGAAPKKVTETFAALKGVFVSWQKDIQADMLIKIAGAIAILATALTILSFADPERLLLAAGVLGSVGAVLLVGITSLADAINQGRTLETYLGVFAKNIGKGLKKLATGVKWKMIGESIKDMAEAIGLIALTIVGLGLMSQKNPEALEDGIMLTVSIAAGIGIMVYAMSKIGDTMSVGMTSFGKAAGGVLALCLAVGIMVMAIKELMEIELPTAEGELAAKMKIFASAILGVGMLVGALAYASKIAGENRVKSGPILAAAASIIIVVKALEMLLGLNITLKDTGKIMIFAGLFVGMGYLIKTMGTAAKDAGGTMKGAATLLALAGVIVILVGALAVLSFIPFKKMLTGALGLGIVLVALGATLKGAGAITDGSNFKTIAAMALLIGALTAALGLLSMIPLEDLAKSVAALGLTLLALAAAFKGMGSVKTDMFGTTLAMIAMVGVIALSLYALSNQPWDSLLAAGAAMALVISSFGLVYLAIGKAGQNTDLQGVALFLTTTLSVIPIAASLYVLSSQPWEGILAAGLALSAVVAAYGLVFKMISETDPNLTAIGLFIFGTTAVIGIAVALRILTDQPWDGLIASGAALSLVLVAMAEAMAIVAKVGQGPATAALKGIALLDLFVADLIAVLAILGGLWSFDWFQNLITGGLDALITIGYGLGDFVGSIISGLGAGLTRGLKDIGKNLSDFMGDEGAGPFFEKVGNLDPGVTQGVKDLASMLLTLTAAEILQGLMSWITGSTKNPLVKFGEQLKEFGPLLNDFATSVKDVNPAKVAGAGAAAQIMANMANTLPNVGGLYQKIFGSKKSLAAFAIELALFGPAIRDFAIAVEDVKPSQVEGAASAAQIMADMADTLPSTGGLYQKIFGEEKTLSEFAMELDDFGPSLTGFAKEVKGIGAKHVRGAAAAGEIMAKMANELPSTESLWNKIFGGGTVSLSDFAAMLVEYGEAIHGFADAVSGIEPEQIDGVVESTKKIADLAKYLEDIDPYSLSTFSYALGSIGEDCVDAFIAAFKESDLKVIAAITIMLTTVTSTMEMGKEKLISTGIASAEALYSGMERGIIEKKGIIVPRVQELGSAMILALQTVLSPEKFELLGSTTISSMILGIDSKRVMIIQTNTTLANAILETLRQILNITVLSLIGANIVTWINLGINNKKPVLMTNVTSTANTVLQRFRSIWNASVYVSIGQSIIQNIIRGINNIRPSLINLSIDTAKEIVRIFQNGLPYYTFYAIGRDVTIGLSNGIYSGKSSAESSAQNVCYTVVSTIQNNLRYDDFYSIGYNVSAGLAGGISSRVSDIAQATASAAYAAIDAARTAFDEHSPSKVMMKIGQYAVEGLAVGIKKNTYQAEESSDSMANAFVSKLKETLSEAINGIGSQDLSADIELNPVMNLKDLQKAVDTTSSAFNNAVNLQVRDVETANQRVEGYTMSKLAQKFSEDKRLDDMKTLLDRLGKSDLGTKVSNQFYIQGEDPETIANEVSYILSRQLERKQVAWGQ